jgi:hypothetical protein
VCGTASPSCLSCLSCAHSCVERLGSSHMKTAASFAPVDSCKCWRAGGARPTKAASRRRRSTTWPPRRTDSRACATRKVRLEGVPTCDNHACRTMKKSAREAERRRRRSSPLARVLKWGLVIVLVAVALYGMSRYSGVPWDDEDIRVVDFSSLSSSAKRTALRRANSARCTCGCGMNLAQCVATDSTCPVRDRNIDAIRAMVREAAVL